ncbi:MarR family winged helix-turn-helix transcriptional regulator [Agreia sp.]|uniref:MarR family winged helix-turn-helix transcriptional regulator n=1 Tax=Agreia sp. TaxID=1872416 RepID=UPI0035BC368F
MLRRDTRPIDELLFEIFRVNDRLLAVGDSTVREVGLTSARWLVLGAIALAESPITVAQIARNMGLSRQAVQRSTNEMAQSGLVAIVENPQRRGSKMIALTSTGTAAYETALELWRSEWTAAMEEVLTEEEILGTMRILRRLRGLVQSKARPRS